MHFPALPAPLRAALAVLAVLHAATVTASAQQPFPSKPINYVVPYTPGGTNDNVARIIARRLAEKAGQPVVIEYKAGAGGTLGAGFVAASPADGYTLLNTSIGNLAIAPQLMTVKFDPFYDLVPVAYIGNSLATVAINPALPIRTLPELIAYARANPGKLTFASSGNGTPGHLAGELLKRLANIDIRHVPYKGSAPAVADVVAGHVDLVFDPLSTQFIKQGKLRALAYFGGARSPDLPNVPSIRDAGIKGWEDSLAGAFFITAPRNVSPEVLARLRQWIGEILAEPDTVAALGRVQVDVQTLTAEQTSQRIRQVHEIAARVVKDSTVQGN
ncbi:Tripartite-type tricarboxylate transporter, receptor component TctC [Cupriavidus sp. OV038]|jgi:tripartite-type tricarboxylate transporter receptor subunit TctC|uniref:Bug family tripartite tricarboxylate transporter substrate binding protein n=1 Tax=unclassified Cupriavidus TaxID=2640874 RepID=UPI0008E25D9A|nr:MULTISPECIES: tripartite tricarboxylate transporter substrate binding protein [unclassified Cupriavidus]SFC23656.1 Tripartite-type tricarboxylate transporter, receptor component TctC [Cupriavidus sp. OV038]SFP17443.1 Tripartite-type tricarboxylate transporter, receptor component TctC [Cupriavidus sp. OV096]